MSIKQGDKTIAGTPGLSGYQTISNLSQDIDTSVIKYPSDAAVNSALALKQDILTAGTGIDISDNIISAMSAVDIDGTTIINNSSGSISANGMIDQNSNVVKYDWIGTLEEYNTALAAGTILDSWTCFITDDLSTLPYSKEQVDAKMTDVETLVASFESTITSLQTELSTITTQLDSIDYVVESGSSDNQWYRLYKSGWLEQGGFLASYNGTITFLKTYSTSTYTALLTHNGNNVKGEGVVHCYNKSTTGMSYGISQTTDGMYGCSWITYGTSA